MSSTLRYKIGAIIFFWVSFSLPGQAQTDTSAFSFLKGIGKPEITLDNMQATWDAASQKFTFSDIIVDWNDIGEDTLRNLLIQKGFNCFTMGGLHGKNADTVMIDPSKITIRVQMDGGNVKVYSVQLLAESETGSAVAAPFNGEFTLILTASKLVNKSVSVEDTFSRKITFENFE